MCTSSIIRVTFQTALLNADSEDFLSIAHSRTGLNSTEISYEHWVMFMDAMGCSFMPLRPTEGNAQYIRYI